MSTLHFAAVGIRSLVADGPRVWIDTPAGLLVGNPLAERPRFAGPSAEGPFAVAAGVPYRVRESALGRLEALRGEAWQAADDVGPFSEIVLDAAGGYLFARVARAGDEEDRTVRVVRWDPRTRNARVLWQEVVGSGSRALSAVGDGLVHVVWDRVLTREPLPPNEVGGAELVTSVWEHLAFDYDGGEATRTTLASHPRPGPIAADGLDALFLADDGVRRVGPAGESRLFEAPNADGFAPLAGGLAVREPHRVLWAPRKSAPRVLFESEHMIRQILPLGDQLAVLVDPETNVVAAALGTSNAVREIHLVTASGRTP